MRWILNISICSRYILWTLLALTYPALFAGDCPAGNLPVPVQLRVDQRDRGAGRTDPRDHLLRAKRTFLLGLGRIFGSAGLIRRIFGSAGYPADHPKNQIRPNPTFYEPTLPQLIFSIFVTSQTRLLSLRNIWLSYSAQWWPEFFWSLHACNSRIIPVLMESCLVAYEDKKKSIGLLSEMFGEDLSLLDKFHDCMNFCSNYPVFTFYP